jgi:hypothetical protein
MSQSDRSTLTEDDVYELLSNARRRFVISHLRSRDEVVELNELSEAVASWENDVPADELTDQQVKRVYVSLYQTHLPKLDESGLIEYDRDAGHVRLTETVSQLDSYLPEGDEREPPWLWAYVSLALVGLLLYVTVLALPTLPLSPTGLGILVIVGFAAVSFAQYLSERRDDW